jgi:hypothetical protein
MTVDVNGSTYTACNIYSPQQRIQKAALENEMTAKLVSASLMPTPIMWVAYDPLAATFDLALTRNLTTIEFNSIRGLVSGSFNAETLRIQLVSVCSTFTSPPDGVCNQVHDGALGSMGFRAEQYVCVHTNCNWVKGGTTYSHGIVQYGDVVYQPSTGRAYGTATTSVCANGVDASFFEENSGQSDMQAYMYGYGPVFGDYKGGFVAGTILVHIGRYSQNIGYYYLYDAETANTCGTSGTDWFATLYSGSTSGPGDSGSGVGVAVTNNHGADGVLAAGIEWGTTEIAGYPAIIMSQWSAVESALGIQSY